VMVDDSDCEQGNRFSVANFAKFCGAIHEIPPNSLLLLSPNTLHSTAIALLY